MHVGSARPSTTNTELAGSTGTYVDDVAPAGCLHAQILRSPHARARITAIDTAAAAALPGVRLVLTGAQLAEELGPLPLLVEPDAIGMARGVVPVLAVDAVRYAGEPVVVVVADDEATAAGAVGLVVVEWDVLPAVLDRDAALLPGSPIVEPGWPDNVLLRQHLDAGDLDAAVAAAAGRVDGELSAARIMASPMEPAGIVASWDQRSGRLTCWASTQNPHVLRSYIGAALGLSTHDVRVIAPRVGGAFGAKIPLRQEELLACHLSRRLRRPVKWIEQRREHLVACGHSRDIRCRYDVAHAADGTILGMRVDLVADVGAASALSGFVMAMNTFMCMPGPYRVTNLSMDLTAVVTNRAPWQAYRGFGKEAASFFLDRIVDHVAAATGVDTVDVRLRNFVPAEEMPYPQPSGPVTDSGDFAACLRLLLDVVDVPSFRQEQAAARLAGRLLGLGFGQELTPEGASPPASLFGGYDSAHVRMSASGDVTVLTGVTSPGTGNETGIAQIVADSLGCELHRIRVVQGDTDISPHGSGNYSSRSLTVGGQAAHLAASDVRAKLVQVGASMLEADPRDIVVSEGRVTVAGSAGPGISLDAVAAEVHLNPHGVHMNDVEPGLEVVRYSKMENVFHQPMTQGRFSMYPNWSNASAAAVVEVDPETGTVTVLRYALVHDSGRIVNPMLADAQLQGAVTQGIGAALYEFVAYDDEGHALSDSFMHYTIPSAKEAVRVEIAHVETPSPYTHLGVKGVGESGISAPSGAIAGAIEDALGLSGALTAPPFTPSRVWSALHAAGGPR
ncbi:xanthine dehydrogenase family protein molybdopterin-binding subunit [Pseudonocardia broussonetiae]|uniref:Xanthine dehydrogenase family protein n=1 Tax=Pseudonocardia broussonetiae TaxID=2736640 RepID=A0A6M6JRK1_9PSEU|nr:xanthine dehydrogenase family protein molybdopterin-binding subunit [Pseudonocardia broussonetiae]QJY48901.1 xanthine dehydrogenase family protein [Pseudonocardia broussonetiae]